MHEMTRKLCWLKLSLLALGVAIVPAVQRADGATTFGVSVGNNFFSPPNSTLNVNDSVQWTWAGSPHSSTSDTGDTTMWDSGIVGTGSTFTKQFTAAGNFPYHCNVHAGQVGTVTVQSAANTRPTVSITSPANNAIFSAPAGFTISATAS